MLTTVYNYYVMQPKACGHFRQLLLQLCLIRQCTPESPLLVSRKELCRDLDGDISACDVYKVLSLPLPALFNWNTHFNEQLINTVSRENHVLKCWLSHLSVSHMWPAFGSLGILPTHVGQSSYPLHPLCFCPK